MAVVRVVVIQVAAVRVPGATTCLQELISACFAAWATRLYYRSEYCGCLKPLACPCVKPLLQLGSNAGHMAERHQDFFSRLQYYLARIKLIRLIWHGRVLKCTVQLDNCCQKKYRKLEKETQSCGTGVPNIQLFELRYMTGWNFCNFAFYLNASRCILNTLCCSFPRILV